ncbi:ATP-binding cassette domain-containing protein [Streptomyces rubellomurinus]|uniref:ATP-binding cassette domain-containing protein n=1 Tax=Streptomyces rubellomurinus (strain ATCC 31215) TaxID=359131 RepID=UPI0005F10218|nr:ABC transporter ATP-binding protein [Streptomyces rubellomurinus]
MTPSRADRPGRAALRLLRSALGRSRPAVLRLLAWSLLSAAPALVAGKALALAVDRGFLAHRPGPAAGWLALFAAVSALGAWASRQTYPWLAEVVEPMRDRLLGEVVSGMLHRAVATHGRADGSGAIAVARLTRQVEAVRDTVAGQLLIVSHFALTAIAVIVGSAALAPAAAALIAGPLLLSLAAFAALAPATARRQREAFAAEEELARSCADALRALRDLVACGAREAAEREVLAAVAANAEAGRALARLAGGRRLIVSLGAHLPLLLVVLAAPALVRHGLTAGAVIGVLAYLTGTLEPALRLLVQGAGASWLRLAVAAERLAAASHPVDATAAARAGHQLPPVDGSFELSGVSFSYGANADPVLDGFDLAVRDGEHLAVVGPSGIGKSTLADIVAGVVAPGHGKVLLGGAAPADLAPADLARARVLLPQDPYVFTGTVAENLRWLAPRATDSAVLASARAVGAEPLLRRLGGLAGHLAPGALSPGERQLIALARAHLSDARLVVLDEATRHLDAAAELRVERAFRSRPGTVVTITHRPGPARRADRVLLLDGSRPRLGTHAGLLADTPAYRHLTATPDPDAAGARPAATP